MRQEWCAFFPPGKWHQWLVYLVTHSAAGVSQVTGGFWKPGEPKKPQNSLDIVLKLPKNIFLCGLLLIEERTLKKTGANIFLNCKMPVIAHINEKLQCQHVKYHSAKRKTGWLKYFECNIVVPFRCFEAYLEHLKKRKKRITNSITYLPLLPSFERRNLYVLKPFEKHFLVFKFTLIKTIKALLHKFKIIKWESR